MLSGFGQNLAQHIGQDAAVFEVIHLDRGVDAQQDLRPGDRAVPATDHQRHLLLRPDLAAEPLPGFQPVNPMVFAGLYPVESSEHGLLRDALDMDQTIIATVKQI